MSEILVVDDTLTNLSVLSQLLSEAGYQVLVAKDGKKALATAESCHPDLILLDVMMPDMDGFEVCKVLKSQDSTKDIPVIFMTALADTEDKIAGLTLGAVDYVTKPFHQEEVLARINTHLTIRRLQKDLQTRNAELNAFSRTVAHDLKNPLSIIVNYVQMVLGKEREVLGENSKRYLGEVEKAGWLMLDIINSLLLLAGVSKQEVETSPLNMNLIVNRAKQRLSYLLEKTGGKITTASSWPDALGYAPWVEAMWANYLSNALKYGGEPPQVEAGATVMGDKVRFWVKDNGPGLSEEQQQKLFKLFSRVDSQKDIEGHGLGLSIVQRIAGKLAGEVGVESQTGQGCVFYFTLPAVAK